MTSVVEKKSCAKGPKGPGQALCGGYDRWFCVKHLLEHDQIQYKSTGRKKGIKESLCEITRVLQERRQTETYIEIDIQKWTIDWQI